jgi:hypothetical protein
MAQSRGRSLKEALINIAVGMGVALVSQLILFPMYDIHIPFSTDLWLVGWFTLISLVRQYVIRRWFNKGD